MSVVVTICINSLRPLTVVLLGALAAGALRAAEPAQPDLKACVAEADPGKRLACFDREMARSSQTPAASAAAVVPTAPAAVAAAPPAAAAATAAASVPKGAPEVARSEDTVVHAKTAEQLLPAHIGARIVHIEVFPYRVIFHLDNEQAWTHEQDASMGTRFRVGDSVNLDRVFGSYWISNPTTERLKVHFIN
jgi:hypothetical protein